MLGGGGSGGAEGLPTVTVLAAPKNASQSATVHDLVAKASCSWASYANTEMPTWSNQSVPSPAGSRYSVVSVSGRSAPPQKKYIEPSSS